MLLAADIGNTNIVLGLFDETGAMLATMRAATRRDATPDEISLLVHHLARKHAVGGIRRTVLCSVVPSLTWPFGEFVRRELSHEPSIVSADLDLGIPLAIDNPKEVGADRIVNALAARETVGSPAVVVDLGTTTNFDCVDRKGRYVGGVLVPGVETSAEELFRRAARLSKVELSFPDKVIGTNTRDALRSGILLGAVGMIDAIVAGIWKELGAKGVALATGGLSPLVGPRCRSIDRVNVNLTLEGLLLVDRVLR
jgi:type III pantothenate kinase